MFRLLTYLFKVLSRLPHPQKTSYEFVFSQVLQRESETILITLVHYSLVIHSRSAGRTHSRSVQYSQITEQMEITTNTYTRDETKKIHPVYVSETLRLIPKSGTGHLLSPYQSSECHYADNTMLPCVCVRGGGGGACVLCVCSKCRPETTLYGWREIYIQGLPCSKWSIQSKLYHAHLVFKPSSAAV